MIPNNEETTSTSLKTSTSQLNNRLPASAAQKPPFCSQPLRRLYRRSPLQSTLNSLVQLTFRHWSLPKNVLMSIFLSSHSLLLSSHSFVIRISLTPLFSSPPPLWSFLMLFIHFVSVILRTNGWSLSFLDVCPFRWPKTSKRNAGQPDVH